MGRRKKEEIVKEIQEKKATLHGDVKRGAVSVVLFAMALLCFLGFFGQAGMLGDFLDKVARSSFGWGKWLTPPVLIGVGVVLLFRKETLFYVSKMIGLFAIFLSVLALFHIYFDGDKAVQLAHDGFGGGYLGFWLSLLLKKMTGKIGGTVILGAFLIVGSIIAFNFSLVNFLKKVIRRKMEGFDEESEETDAEVIVEHKVQPEMLPEDASKYEDEPGVYVEEKSKMPVIDKIFGKKKSHPKGNWLFPSLQLFEASSEKSFGGDVENNKRIIQATLKHFGIDVEPAEVKVGPTITQYCFKPADGVKLERITGLSNNLALALAAVSIRIEAPIPGKSLVGIEVPNKSVAKVRMRELLAAAEFEERESNLLLALGKDVNGNFVYGDLKKMPHLLVAGSTGSGKSVCVNSIILSLLYQNSPDDLKLIMVDPKRVELSLYNGIPHLLSDNIIVESGKVLAALKWVVGEMTRRFKAFEQSGSKDIMSHNRKAEEGEIFTHVDPETNETIEEPVEKIPYIVVIVDELAELMQTHAKEVEGPIIRIAQLGRAAGIHLVLSTQKPIVTVITSLIKSNIPTRIAFRVPSLTDSRTILDGGGAEKLLGNGDMLFSTASAGGFRRLQGIFVSEDEIKGIVGFIKKQKVENIEDEIGVNITEGAPGEQQELNLNSVEKLDFGSMKFEEEKRDDPLYDDAKSIVIQMGKASTSLLQRRLGVGYARAARLIDVLEENGVVGPADGAKPREILVGKSEGTDYEDDIKDQSERDKWQM